VREAAQLMDEEDVGSLPIVETDEGRLIGIVIVAGGRGAPGARATVAPDRH
jgi:CBS domain-containing protein